MERTVKTDITTADEGKILLPYLAQRFQYCGIEEWRAHIEEGRLTVNGEQSLADRVLVRGDTLSFERPSVEEPPVNLAYSIAWEDEHFLIVDKGAPLPVHPAGIYFKHTLWHALVERSLVERSLVERSLVEGAEGTQPFLHFAGRLDRETSGLLTVCKTREAAAHFQKLQDTRAPDSRLVEKRYTVLVHGAFPEGTTGARGWIGADTGSIVRKKMRYIPLELCSTAPEPGFKPCATVFSLVSEGGGFSLLEAKLETGRTHQIRATLSSLGYPVVGDKLYGLDEGWFVKFIEDRLSPEDRAALILDRQALHSSFIRFPDLSGNAIEASSRAPFSIPPTCCGTRV